MPDTDIGKHAVKPDLASHDVGLQQQTRIEEPATARIRSATPGVLYHQILKNAKYL